MMKALARGLGWVIGAPSLFFLLLASKLYEYGES